MKASRHKSQQNGLTNVSGTEDVRSNDMYAYYVYKIRDEILSTSREP